MEERGSFRARVWGSWPGVAGHPPDFSVPPLQAMLHQEGHMDDALSLTRCQQEESQAARMIYSTAGLYNQFIK